MTSRGCNGRRQREESKSNESQGPSQVDVETCLITEFRRLFLTLAMLDSLDELWPQFLLHHYTTVQQRDYIRHIKDASSENGVAVVQLDFAENFSLISQTEIQSAHWSHHQATIFTVHIKLGAGHRNLAIISNYMQHTTEFVYCAQSKCSFRWRETGCRFVLLGIITRFIKTKYQNVKEINYVSDGASAHFKNNKNMMNLTFHSLDFGLPASWTFSATSHGKGPVDGIGAAVKSRATRYLLGLQKERAFLSPWEFFDFVNRATDHQRMIGDLEPNRPIDVFHVTSYEVEKIHVSILSNRWSILPKQWIRGIQRMHQFNSARVWHIVSRPTSSSTHSQEFQIDR